MKFGYKRGVRADAGGLSAPTSTRSGSSVKRIVTGLVLALGVALMPLGLLPASPAAAVGSIWVYFDPMGGTGCTCQADAMPAPPFRWKVVGPATDPSIPGMIMTGWYTAPTGPALKWDFSPSSPYSGGGQTFTLYARYVPATLGSPPPAPDVHTVTFDSTDGAAVAAVTVTGTVAIPAPDAPAKAGSTFDGWFTAATGGTLWDFSTPVNADLTLYAHWSVAHPATVSTTFDTQGGSAVASETTGWMTPVRKPVDPTKAGSSFAGWYTAATGGQGFDFATPVASSQTLFAHWTTAAVAVPAPQTLAATGANIPVGLPAVGALLILLGAGLLRRSRKQA